MTGLGYGESILLGILQGLTEFLPVSSSGHLAFAERLLGLDPGKPDMLLLNVLTHLSTVLAVIVVFHASIRRFCRRLVVERREVPRDRRYAWRIVLLTVIASVPTAGIGFTLKGVVERAFTEPVWIGVFLGITGVVLAGTACVGRGRRGWRRVRWWHALIVGIAQGCAVFPGISRSGATICAAAYCGMRRRWTVEFSFLLAVPAIVGASCLLVGDTLALPAVERESIRFGPVAVGCGVSFIVGVAALKLLMGAVRRGKLHYFAVYCWLVGLLAVAGIL